MRQPSSGFVARLLALLDGIDHLHVVLHDVPEDLLADQLTKMLIVPGLYRAVKIVIEQSKDALVRLLVLGQINVRGHLHQLFFEAEVLEQQVEEAAQDRMNQVPLVLACDGIFEFRDKLCQLLVLCVDFRDAQQKLATKVIRGCRIHIRENNISPALLEIDLYQDRVASLSNKVIQGPACRATALPSECRQP